VKTAGLAIFTQCQTSCMSPQELEAMKARLKAMEEEVKAKEAQVCCNHTLQSGCPARAA
jgi:hypothetical protein